MTWIRVSGGYRGLQADPAVYGGYIATSGASNSNYPPSGSLIGLSKDTANSGLVTATHSHNLTSKQLGKWYIRFA